MNVLTLLPAGTQLFGPGEKVLEAALAPPHLDVPLVVYAPGTVQPGQSSTGVETTCTFDDPEASRISPIWLQAVQREGTQVLPALHNGY